MARKEEHNVYIEYNGNKINHKDLIEKARAVWKESGNKAKDLETVDIYFKPDENKSYYVINDKSSNRMEGSF